MKFNHYFNEHKFESCKRPSFPDQAQFLADTFHKCITVDSNVVLANFNPILSYLLSNHRLCASRSSIFYKNAQTF